MDAPPPAEHKPYVPDHVRMPEFTWSALLLGSVLGIIFGASSLYLVLKVGMTVSASIPVAVLSITLFRAFSRAFGVRRATILENNIVQTAGSAGESIAFGVGVTMPALLLLGFEMNITRVMVVAVLGGLLGILMMIPLRRAFIVRLHGRPGEPGKLVYPEGTACAQVLISGEKGGASGQTVFIGFGLAFAHEFVTGAMSLLRSSVDHTLTFFNRAAVVASDMASALLGVGYIIGVRTASIMMAGAVLGYLVIVPTIAIFGDQMTTAPYGGKLIRDMSIGDLRQHFILFIGAGCVATAGIISMCRTLPMIVRSLGAGLGTLRRGNSSATAEAGGARRTEDDMSIRTVFLGSLLLIVLLTLFIAQDVQWFGALLGAALVVVFGFLFVTVSSRLTGEIGSTSNPISGMTVATLSLTCLIFLLLNMTGPIERVLALSIGAVVCIAASNGGTTSQDLKTGFLVGGTPRYQQYAILIGALSSALVIGGFLYLFNQAGAVYTAKNLPTVNVKDRITDSSATETYDGKTYRVWWSTNDPVEGVPPGKYLVNDDGSIAYYVDPAVTGKLYERDDGSDVKLKFEAPKTQVMYLIISGVLEQKLNWGLVLIGAMIAITLELCGISSLPFAVGVYIPPSVSTPIFVGGLVRWLVDKISTRAALRRAAAVIDPAARAKAEIDAIAKTETSPGVLLASGYIAGGTLAGVVIAFLEFAPATKGSINFVDQLEGTVWHHPGVALGVFAILIVILLAVGVANRTDTDQNP
jgi:putative OPT family oligopeptide transporter